MGREPDRDAPMLPMSPRPASRVTAPRVAVSILVVAGGGATPVAAFEFTEVSGAAGIVHGYEQDPGNLVAMDREYAILTGGAVAEDFDGDGWVDLFVLRGGTAPNLLYMNQGDGTFEEQAALRGAGHTARHAGVCGADYDSDGDIDLFVTAVESPHLLLVNDGGGSFSARTGVVPRTDNLATGPSWVDIDRDGLLDLALGSWSDGDGAAIHIYRNLGADGFARFQWIPIDYAFTPHFADLDGDGSADLVAVADFLNARFFLNDGRGVLLPAGGSDIQNGMGVATGDPDHDGDLDVFMTAIGHRDPGSNTTGTDGNRLLNNNGHGEFTDITDDAGVRDGYWGWGAVFADLDNDGDEDLYHVNGFVDFAANLEPFRVTPAVLFENVGGLEFVEVAASSGDAADTGQGRCVVSFDYDNDGDLDLFIVNNSTVEPADTPSGFDTAPGELVLLRNDSEPVGRWLKVRVDGDPPHHPHGMGARVIAELSGSSQLREINASSNFNGHGPYRIAHFGAGEAALFDAVTVRFPNGDAVRLENVETDRELVVDSPRALVGRRQVAVGGTITFDLPDTAVPAGGEAVWAHDGAEHPDPAQLTFAKPGIQTVGVEVFGDPSRAALVRAESFRIEVVAADSGGPSIARTWNEMALDAIRIDFPNPAVHARNLFHLSVAMWDAWAAYDPVAVGYLHRETIASADPAADRREAISYAAYRVLSSRYTRSLNASASQLLLDFLMADLGYPVAMTSTAGDSPAALGNRIAATVLGWGADDGSGEADNYHDADYRPANPPLVLAESGAALVDPNRWQPLRFERALTQNGLFTLPTQIFAGSQWGRVRPFALLTESPVYLDPGPPPQLGGAGDPDYRQGALEVVRYSSWLDPDDGVMIEISPKSRGQNRLGRNDGIGHGAAPNPATGEPYREQWVKRGDYGRVVAEFWADGPDSETPPGHWNALANQVSDHPEQGRQFLGEGEPMGRLEWDVKLYFALNAALHDAAVAAWGCKRFYDYVRPISSIRYLSGRGELPESPGLVEAITPASAAPGGRHAHLVEAGAELGDTAICAWGGPPDDPADHAGKQWILGEDWLPYQRASFVTPAFAGYVSGHSTFSRAAAEVLARFTGDRYFPGGLGRHHVPAGSLEFEAGPGTDVTLEWATYFDAADEAGISRLFGGIHFPVDDGPGRVMGSAAGIRAMGLAARYFDGTILGEPFDLRVERGEGGLLLRAKLVRGLSFKIERSPDLRKWSDEAAGERAPGSELLRPVGVAGGQAFFRAARGESQAADPAEGGAAEPGLPGP